MPIPDRPGLDPAFKISPVSPGFLVKPGMTHLLTPDLHKDLPSIDMKKRAILIDCDPGLDDAINLLLAFASSRECHLLGITTVAGNVGLELTQRNARIICQLAGFPEVPVYAGCARPMLREAKTARNFHGESGLLGIDLFEPEVPLQELHAVDFIVETLMAAEAQSITLLPVGPLTNIAMAIVKEPRILPKIEEIVLMGGSARAGGNVTPVAEFNIYADPHAAHVVFNCGRPLVVMGLDVTHQALMTKKRIEPLTKQGTPVARLAQTLLESIMDTYRKKFSRETAPLHDPCTMAYLLSPELFRGEAVLVAVETNSELTMGATIVDNRQLADHPPNATWMTHIDADGFFSLITERIALLGEG